MKKLAFLILFVLPTFGMAQKVGSVSGTVTDMITGEPLKDSHIYLTEKYGVVSASDGSFTLTVPSELADEDLKVSYIGFKTYEIPVREVLSGNLTIELESTALLLPEDMIVVTPKPMDNIRDAVIALLDGSGDVTAFYSVLIKEFKDVDPELKNFEEFHKSEFMIPTFIALALVALLLSPRIVRKLNNRKN